MDREDEYAEEVHSFLQAAKAVEDSWKEKSDDNKRKATTVPSIILTSCGYRSMGWRPSKSYFRGGCDRCAARSVRSVSICAGCRRNGDGYGSDLYYCTNCGLFDWDSYDEA